MTAVRRDPVGLLTWLLAPALILAGGLWSHFGRVQRRLTLPLHQAVALGPEGAAADLNLRLESLEAPLAEPAYRLFTGPAGKGAEGLEIREGQEGRLPGGFTYRIEALLPNAFEQGGVRDNPEAPENPALRILVGIGTPEPLIGLLFAHRAAEGRFDEPGGRFSVLYQDAWTPESLVPAGAKGPLAERVRLTHPGGQADHAAKVGEAWTAAGLRLRVVGTYPDFEVRPDAQGRPQPATKSDQPNEPWLELAVEGLDGLPCRVLLSARHPEVTDALNAPNLPPGVGLRYLRPQEAHPERLVVFTHSDQQVRLVEGHTLRRTEAATLNHPFLVGPGLSVTPLQRLERAEAVHDFVPHPDPVAATRYERPALRLKVSTPSGGPEKTLWLDGKGADGRPETVGLFGGKLQLTFGPRPLEQRDLHPVISLSNAQGRELARPVPSEIAGWHLALASGPSPAAGAVTVQVQREPGLVLLYLGCALLVLGLGWSLVLQPRRPRTPQV